MSFAAASNYLRPRNGHGTAPVTQIELFFDLVFVFTVTQLSTELRANLTPLGLVHTLILFTAVWWVWVYTSWVTNWLDPKHRPVQLMIICLMLFGLLLSTSLPDAFGARGLVFAGSYVAMQLGRSLFMLWASQRYDEANFLNMRRISVWVCASGIFWIAGGFCPADLRALLWLAALALDCSSPALGFFVPGLGRSVTTDWSIDSYHLAERCAGFILIALGESITVTGETFFELHWNLSDTTAFVAAFAVVVALWWIYFDRAAELTADAFAESADPGRIARAAYTYVHGLLVAGIIIVAAGDALLLHHPSAPAGLASGMMILGGPALYLLGNGVFRRLVHPLFPRSHIFGLAALAVIATVTPFISMLELTCCVAIILVAMIVYSDVLFRRQGAAK